MDFEETHLNNRQSGSDMNAALDYQVKTSPHLVSSADFYRAKAHESYIAHETVTPVAELVAVEAETDIDLLPPIPQLTARSRVLVGYRETYRDGTIGLDNADQVLAIDAMRLNTTHAKTDQGTT